MATRNINTKHTITNEKKKGGGCFPVSVSFLPVSFPSSKPLMFQFSSEFRGHPVLSYLVVESSIEARKRKRKRKKKKEEKERF